MATTTAPKTSTTTSTTSASGRATIPRWGVPLLSPVMYKSGAGGRGAGKTHEFSQLAVMRMAGLLGNFGYPDGPVRICSARQFQRSIGESVKQAARATTRSGDARG